MPVIGSPIILHIGERLSELQAHAEVVAVLEVVGENLQQRPDAMPGSFTYSDSVICNMLKSDLNAAFRSQGRGYRARSGVPCVFR
ncbi:MAG: hypothetical protein IT385_05185 [Deltaproteobacteria bacterium]|nr:hypothetical protein [Deltaproteobacteria bacterium]